MSRTSVNLSRPEWVRTLNALADPGWIALDEASLLEEAMRNTELSDFGGDAFREPLRVFLEALEGEARLHALGRLLARADLLNLLENRLRIAEARKRHPEIDRVALERPIFITGLPRTGTSILHELLGRDPASRVPLAWEVRYPCPPPEDETRESDARIERADAELRFWDLIVPEYAAMHELGGRVPVECIQLMAHEFRSDELSGRYQVPSYAAWLAQADLRPAYAYHRRMLQLLSWRAPGRWVLKAPSHLGALDALLAVYPDARIVQTHRDPLTVMASVASILFATAWLRTDAVEPETMRQWFTGETCVALLAAGEATRRAAEDPSRFHDVLYSDLMSDPFGTLAALYDHFGLPFSAEAEASMRAYLASRPKGRHGAHAYRFEDLGLDLESERRRFSDYQKRYGVPSEVGE